VAILAVSSWKTAGTYQPFSYAAYRIHAALVGHPEVEEVRVFEAHRWTTVEFENALEEFDPDVIGGSTYVWSLRAFVDIAARMKSNRPDRTFILGGPSARPEMLAIEMYRDAVRHVDALVLGEGEEAMREIVAGHGSGTAYLASIPGLAIAKDGGWHKTDRRPPIQNLDAIPSPFQLGLAPQGVSGHLETFRGCPLSCLFCEWGISGNRGSFYSKEYLVRELEAFLKVGSKRVFQVDAGLNLHANAFRNLAAAEAETKALAKSGINCEIYPSKLRDEHLDFLGSLAEAHVGVGLQSYNTDVLKLLQRPFNPERLETCVNQLAEVATPSVEIILGLPGDNPASFRETFRRARELPSALRVYYCLVLPDAFLTRAPASFELKFDPVTMQMQSCLGWSPEDLQREMDYLSEQAILARGNYSIQPHGHYGPSPGSDTGAAGGTATWWHFPSAVERPRQRAHPPAPPRLDFPLTEAQPRRLPVARN